MSYSYIITAVKNEKLYNIKRHLIPKIKIKTNEQS